MSSVAALCCRSSRAAVNAAVVTSRWRPKQVPFIFGLGHLTTSSPPPLEPSHFLRRPPAATSAAGGVDSRHWHVVSVVGGGGGAAERHGQVCDGSDVSARQRPRSPRHRTLRPLTALRPPCGGGGQARRCFPSASSPGRAAAAVTGGAEVGSSWRIAAVFAPPPPPAQQFYSSAWSWPAARRSSGGGWPPWPRRLRPSAADAMARGVATSPLATAAKPTDQAAASLADELMQQREREAAASQQFATEGYQQQQQQPAKEDLHTPAGDEAGGGGGGGGDDRKGPKPLSKWQKWGYVFFGVLFTGSIVANAIIFSLPDRDENDEPIEDDFSPLPLHSQHFQRLKARFFKTKKDLEEPFSDKLLPDPLPEPYHQPKYTILLELTGILVHASWTHKHGWRFQKRPGVDMFLSQVGYPHFEVVIYSTENAMTFYPIVDGLDPGSQWIMYRLFRDATRYVNGHHVKDLKAMNRDLKKVIVVDWNGESVSLNSENALLLKKWEGDNADRALIGLAQLLQAVRQSDVDDVRDVLEYYKQFDDPIEAFRENQRRLQDEMAAQEERRQKDLATKKSSLLSSWSAGFSRRH